MFCLNFHVIQFFYILKQKTELKLVFYVKLYKNIKMRKSEL